MGEPTYSTGLPSLDQVLKGIYPGDNIVYQVGKVDEYRFFLPHHIRAAHARGQQVTYFRFGHHDPLLTLEDGAQLQTIDPGLGFEPFVNRLHQVIHAKGRGNYFVFDCLSGLAADWYSDQMLANLFMLTCPYLYDIEAVACFAVERGRHAIHTTNHIQQTAQVWIDVYTWCESLFIQPIKVQRRYANTMFMLHEWNEQQFQPVTDSATIADVLTSAGRTEPGAQEARLGLWNRTLLQAEQAGGFSAAHAGRETELFDNLLPMLLTRDERMQSLAHRYLKLDELVRIGQRVIGSGQIGGKALGMLLARAILRARDPRWHELLETHDSFFIGSDVFYTFLVTNGIWWLRERQRDPVDYLEGSERARQRILVGQFPAHIQTQFAAMLDYFGQSPIIVRSSSLLEDNYGNAFAGKYESVFCVNQGPREKCLEDFLSAVRMIYASTMSEKALTYRAQRGLLERDEQMGLLVQRVSGSLNGRRFFPHIGGVGLSYNPYVWSPAIDPAAGMLRMVFGLGTRAVDRADDDYTRIIALNAPERRPESNFSQVRQFAQRRIDALDLETDQLVTLEFEAVAASVSAEVLDAVASMDETLPAGGKHTAFNRVLTFTPLIQKTRFIEDMRDMLTALQDAYDYPVDVEFTVNFNRNGGYKINLVQCRPLQTRSFREARPSAETPHNLPAESVLLEVHGAIIGQSRELPIDRILYVNPDIYSVLPQTQRYSIARLIGQLTHLPGAAALNMLLLGPGRWGTSSPSLGVPVELAEISPVCALCEIVGMGREIIPDVSLGTHFFNDLVELDMLYMALFPGKENNSLSHERLLHARNRIAELLPEAAHWSDAVHVIDAASFGSSLFLHADSMTQTAVLCLQPKVQPPATH